MYDAYSVSTAARTAYGDPSAANLTALGGEVLGAGLGLALPGGGYSGVDDVAEAGLDLARGLTRSADEVASGACFVSGTVVATALASSAVERIELGDRVAAASTDGDQEPTVELEEPRPARRAAWAPRALCVLLAACGPQLGEPVQTYDARTGFWNEAPAALEVGDEYLVDGHLYRVTADGVEDRGVATVDDLAVSDEAWAAEASRRVPGGDEWVLVLGAADDAGHWRLAEVEPGERVAFQGRVFDTADADGDGRLEVRVTGDVIGRVYQTHVRHSDTVIDLVVSGPSGPETITGTPEHQFWVPAVGDYVPLGELRVGTVLRTAGGGEAQVASTAWRHGDFEVFNFEVEGAHNYYVQGPGGAGDAVLVHNGCGNVDALSRAANTPGPYGESAAARALDKHGSRPGSAFPAATGGPAAKTQQAADIVDDILTTPGTTSTSYAHPRLGDVTDVVAPDGRGLRYSDSGDFIGFLEPPPPPTPPPTP